MNLKNTIITATVVSGLLLGYYVYSKNTVFKDFIDENIIGKKLETVVIPEKWVYLIADGTGSGFIDYRIPKIETDFIDRLCDSVRKTGGKVWLNFIDKNSKNNTCLYFQILKNSNLETEPVRRNGESPYSYEERVTKWKTSIDKMKSDSVKSEEIYYKRKTDFINKCDDLLRKQVYIGNSINNKQSDVIGLLNAAFKSFGVGLKETSNKYIVAFSDLQQDTPDLNPLPELDAIPEGLNIMMINPVPGSSNKCIDEITEIESSDRALEIIFKDKYK